MWFNENEDDANFLSSAYTVIKNIHKINEPRVEEEKDMDTQ